MAVILLIGFLFLILIGLPVGFAMGTITVIAFWALGFGRMLMIVAQKLSSGTDNFVFLCIPLYILAAEIMASGKLTEKIVHFCDTLVGHITGGLAYVNVMASMLFAGISGSASADASGLGKIEIDILDRAGYPRDFSGAVTAASAIIGPIVPPSNIMIIYAVVAQNVTVAAMFMAGVLPGLMIGLAEIILCYIAAKKYHFPRRARRSSLAEIAKSAYKTLPCLILPLIILGGIATGVFTATESGAVATLYALIISCLVMRTVSVRELFLCCRRAAKTTANVLFIIAVAAAMGWAITTMRIPQQITEFCVQYIHNRWVFLIFINILLLLIGMILDQSPALLIIVPILLPVSQTYGIHPLHFGIITCLNLTIGLITPPVGMTLFVTANVGKIKLSSLFRSIIPFVIACIVVLIIVSCFEGFSTWLPNLIL